MTNSTASGLLKWGEQLTRIEKEVGIQINHVKPRPPASQPNTTRLRNRRSRRIGQTRNITSKPERAETKCGDIIRGRPPLSSALSKDKAQRLKYHRNRVQRSREWLLSKGAEDVGSSKTKREKCTTHSSAMASISTDVVEAEVDGAGASSSMVGPKGFGMCTAQSDHRQPQRIDFPQFAPVVAGARGIAKRTEVPLLASLPVTVTSSPRQDSSTDAAARIDLTSRRLSDSAACEALRSLPPVKCRLDLSRNRLFRGSLSVLSQEVLYRNLLVCELSLESCALGDHALERLAAGLDGNSNLVALNLSSNHFGVRGASSLANVLQQNLSMLRHLSVADCPLGDDGAAVIFAGVAASVTLRDFAAAGVRAQCEAGSRAESALRAIVCENTHLIHLDISRNGLTPEACTRLGEALQSNHTLLGLHLAGDNAPGATLDALGHVHVRSTVDAPTLHPLLLSGRALGRWIDQPGHLCATRPPMGHPSLDNCWVCAGWSSQTFEWRVGVSGRAHQGQGEDTPDKVYVHLEYLKWQGFELTQRTAHGSTTNSGAGVVFEGVAVVPPGWVRYFFTCSGNILIAEDQPAAFVPQGGSDDDSLLRLNAIYVEARKGPMRTLEGYNVLFPRTPTSKFPPDDWKVTEFEQ